MVLLPKGGGEYYGIGLAEVVCKVVTDIFNFRFTTSIDFHNLLHVLREGCGTDTAFLEAKLIQ